MLETWTIWGSNGAMTKIITISDYNWQKQQERLKRIMEERYGTIEKEWEAFLQYNREFHCREGHSQSVQQLEKSVRKTYKDKLQ